MRILEEKRKKLLMKKRGKRHVGIGSESEGRS